MSVVSKSSIFEAYRSQVQENGVWCNIKYRAVVDNNILHHRHYHLCSNSMLQHCQIFIHGKIKHLETTNWISTACCCYEHICNFIHINCPSTNNNNRRSSYTYIISIIPSNICNMHSFRGFYCCHRITLHRRNSILAIILWFEYY